VKTKIAVVLVDRANYGRLRPVMMELQKMKTVELLTVCSGTMLLERFGSAHKLVRQDGFHVDSEIYLEVEGSVPITMTKSVGLAVIEFASEFQRLRPDFVLIIGDRYEAMGAAIAAAYQNICIIHLQGGEVTGSIDESTRHAITKLSHFHFPATKRAGDYIVGMGENPADVFALGCPCRDVVKAAGSKLPVEYLNKLGVGAHIDFEQPYLLVLFHPVTTEIPSQEAQMEALLGAILEFGLQTVILWPNIDAGSDAVSHSIRRFREHHHGFRLHALKNLESQYYIPLLQHAACCLGNSSSFVRETSFLGTPVVLVGSRQDGREWSPSVVRVEPEKPGILVALKKQLEHGRYQSSDLYGQPGVSERIASQIGLLKPYSQKKLDYIRRGGVAV